MSFLFLSFPYVVHREIILSMTYSDIFNMSICSKKLRRLIRSISLKEIAIQFHLKGEEIVVEVVNRRKEKAKMVSMMPNPEFHTYFDSERIPFGQVSDGISPYWITESDSGTYFTYCYSTGQDAFVEAGVFKHLFEIMTHSPAIQLKIRIENNMRGLPDIDFVKDTQIDGCVRSLDWTVIEEIFTKYPNQNSAYISPMIEGEVPRNWKLFEVPRLYIKNSLDYAPRILQGFTGRHLVLNDSSSGHDYIIQFFKSWMSNNSHRNLKTLRIVDLYRYRIHSILAQIEHTRWDPEKRPRIYKYNPRIINVRNVIEMDCSEYVDLVRESDSQIASLRITNRVLNFFVWC